MITKEEKIPVGVFGAGGRMGRALQAQLSVHPRLTLAAAVGRDEVADLSGCAVVIDFSLPEALGALLDQIPPGCPLVSGVTGYSKVERARLETHSLSAPLLWAENFSLGIAALRYLAREAAQRLPNFEVELFELHHKQKKDAPSGTALRLIEEVERGRGRSLPQRAPLAPRTKGAEVGISVGRAGQVIGEHQLIFFGENERLELVHRAGDRRLFVDGAIEAAEQLIGAAPGLYTLEQLLWGDR